ncbi:major facilitator superfamily domain-containing protein [Xylariales sp. PMI_506]|nr:major facilitator superfamily domain-containing protein [Xylariales sp. PMI_506]
MDFYHVNLAVFASASTCLLYRQYQRGRKEIEFPLVNLADIEYRVKGDDEQSARTFQIGFFLPYALAVAADWLQGPQIYAIYKYEKNIQEKTVAALYAAGFVSGGISASFTGGLADKFGRKKACLLYCVLYIVTCCTMLSNHLPVLFFGRLCAGVSTTLLFTVFEAWMISEYHDRGVQSTGLELSSIFGNMTTLSCVVAISSGILGDILVVNLGSRIWPFLAAAICCMGAAYFISTIWEENFGVKSIEEKTPLQDLHDGVTAIIRDPQILALSVISCFFEGTMYLFIFFWSAALKSARTVSGSTDDLPFGVIFSSFMCAMMIGSAIFSLQTASHNVKSTLDMMMIVTLIVSCCLSLAAMLRNQAILFWVLCVLEGCIGVYFPSIAFLKSQLINDGIRGQVYSILRFPVNTFVVMALSLDEEGDAHRNHIFLTCAALLLVAFMIARKQRNQA